MKHIYILSAFVVCSLIVPPTIQAFTIFKEAATTNPPEVLMGDKTSTVISYMDARICRSFINHVGNTLSNNSQSWEVVAGGTTTGGQGYYTKTIGATDTATRLADMKAALIASFDEDSATNCVNNSTLVCGAPQTADADTVGSDYTLNSSGQYQARCIFQFPSGYCIPSRIRHVEIIMNVVDGNTGAPTACSYTVDYGEDNYDSENTAKKSADVSNVLLGTIGLSVAEVKDYKREGETSAENNDT